MVNSKTTENYIYALLLVVHVAKEQCALNGILINDCNDYMLTK
jgi:hypothetical protein